MPRIEISARVFASELTAADKPALFEHLQQKEIYDHTCSIPFPYKESDADWWIQEVAAITQDRGHAINWAIRRTDGYMIGSIGLHGWSRDPIAKHRAEIGYWLAKPYWGVGIMTEVVGALTRFAFTELGLHRLTAHVFSMNEGSARVLEKCGYRREGVLRDHYFKNGRFQDSVLYARLSSDA